MTETPKERVEKLRNARCPHSPGPAAAMQCECCLIELVRAAEAAAREDGIVEGFRRAGIQQLEYKRMQSIVNHLMDLLSKEVSLQPNAIIISADATAVRALAEEKP